jgi:hypothetical protein
MDIFVIAMLVLSIITAHLLNTKKIQYRDLKFVFQSTLEGFFGFLFIYFFFLQGYINLFVVISILIVLMIATGLVLFIKESQFDTWDLVIETSKNVIVVFLKTVLPLMFFLSVFRFNAWYLQIIFTLISIIGMVVLLKGLTYLFRKPLESLQLKFSMSNFNIIATAWIVFGIFFALIFTFNFQTNRLEYMLNLSNSTTYLQMDGYETALLNQFKDEEIFRVQNAVPEKRYDDYYIDGNHLYLYYGSIDKDTIYYYNLDTDYSKTFNYYNDAVTVNSSEITNVNPLNNVFTKVDDGVILSGDVGIYHINEMDITKFYGHDKLPHDLFFHDDEIYFLVTYGAKSYGIYSYDEDTITLQELLDLRDDVDASATMKVIDKKLYYVTTETVQLYQSDLTYNIEGINLPYSIHDGLLYAAYHDDIDLDTKYYKIEGSNQELLVYPKYHNILPKVADNYVYYLDLTGIGDKIDNKTRINVHNKDDLTATAIVYHLENNPFNKSDNWQYNYVIDYKVDGDDLYYMQIEYGDEGSLLTYHKVSESESFGIPFTFYSHLGIGMLPIIIAAVFIPVTNYRDYITIISLENILKKKTQ